jgi:cob(I)alamin adenosyltransferase
MLKTYRIIPLVFILFLFGFTLITVAPVFAEDSPEFVACQQMPFGNQKEARQKKNCFRDVARLYHRQLRDSVQSVVPLETSGGEVAELNARIVESQSQVATLTTTNTQLQGDLRVAQEALVPLSASFRDLDAHVVTLTTTNVQLQEQLAAANAALEPLNARIAESELQVATLTTTNTQLQGDLRVAQEALVPLNAKVTQSHQERESAVKLNNECVARYMTEIPKAEKLQEYMVAVDYLKAKLNIYEQGVAQIGVIGEKLWSYEILKDKSELVCRLGKRKTFSNKAARDVVKEIRYGLSCIAFKAANGAAAACGPDIVGKY